MLKKILILAIFALILATPALALTDLTHKYITQQALENKTSQDCLTQLYNGTILNAENPDFKEKETTCLNNDDSCIPYQIADKYKKQVNSETNNCAKAFDYGVSSRFYTDAIFPTSWNNYDPLKIKKRK